MNALKGRPSHISKTTVISRVECNLCHRLFCHRPSLKSHIQDHHDGAKARLTPLKCPKDGCVTLAMGRSYFLSHLVKHGYSTETARRIADQQNERFGPSATPQPPAALMDRPQGSSAQEKIGRDGGAYSCIECDETFTALVDLDVHLKKHQDDFSSYSCMSAQGRVSEGGSSDAEPSTNAKMEEMEHQKKDGGQEKKGDDEEFNEKKSAPVINKLDQLKQDLERASGDSRITEFILSFLKPVIVEESSGNKIAVYVPLSNGGQ